MARKDSEKAAKVRECVRKWDTANKRNVAHYHEMTNFIMGEQWEDNEAKLFEDYKKVPLTANKLAPMMNHLLGEQRQNTANLQIEPSDDVDEQSAEVRDALVKEIALNSDAVVIYQTAFEQAVIGGYSGFAYGTEYESNENNNQVITQRCFKDPTKLFWDLGCESPCKTDGMHSGFRTNMSRKMFASKWGKSLERKVGDMSTDVMETDDIVLSFADEKSITVIDFFERKSKISTLFQMSNGEFLKSKELKKLEKLEGEKNEEGEEIELYIMDSEIVRVENQRSITEYKVMHSKWAGDYELESTEFPSEQLPVIFVDQHSYYDKQGHQIFRSFFKDAKDTQRFINYLRTQIAYLIKVSRYDQFMLSKNNVRGADTQALWRDPTTQQGGLWYDESESGTKPEQLRPPELSASLIQQYESATRDLQTTTGMYDTQMGENGNEISGRAVDARIKAGSYNTYLPRSSLDRAITCGGTIVNEMIPKVYDTERKMRLTLKDKGITKVDINKPMDDYGMQTQNDMTKGKFKIRLVAGQSFEGQKSENLESMDMVLQKNPGAFNLIGDLYVENLPMANNIEMRNRLRTMIPPEVIEAGKTGKPLPPKPPQQDPMVMIKQQELQMKMQQAQIDAQAKQQELQLKEQDLMMRSHQAGIDFSKEIQNIEVKKQETMAKLKEQELRYQAEMTKIQHDAHINHTQNVVKILTHQPNHFEEDNSKQPNNEGNE